MKPQRQREDEYSDYKKANNSFKRLALIIGSLQHQEVKLIVKYLNAFDFEYKPQTTASQLLEYLYENKQAEEAVTMEFLGYKGQKKNFGNIVQRVRDTIEEVITHPFIVERKGSLTPKRRKALYRIDQRLMTYYAYYEEKNLPFEGYGLLLKVIRDAKQYEYYNRLLDALYYRRKFLKIRVKSPRFIELTKEIEHYEKCLRAERNAKTQFEDFTQLARFNGDPKELMAFEPEIEKLEKDYKETQSRTVEFFWYQMKLAVLIELRKFKEATQLATHGLELVNSDAIFTPTRMGMAYANLADVYLNSHAFEKALHAIEGAQSYYKKNSWNFKQMDEYEFFCFFYSANYEKAEKKILSLVNTPFPQSKFLSNKWQFLHAAVLFVTGRTVECIGVLEKLDEFTRDKDGWNVGRKVLAIMALINNTAQENVSLTESKLRSLKREIAMLKQRKAVRRRDVTILSLLNDLLYYNCDFQKVHKLRKSDFALLEKNDIDYRHILTSYEPVIVQEWIYSRLAKQPYKVDLRCAKLTAKAAM